MAKTNKMKNSFYTLQPNRKLCFLRIVLCSVRFNDSLYLYILVFLVLWSYLAAKQISRKVKVEMCNVKNSRNRVAQPL